MTIYKIDLGEDKAKELSKKISDLITSFDGKILENNFWGKRKFAYEINKKTEGFYDVTVFEMEKDKVINFKSKLNLEEGLVRYLVCAQN